MNANRYTRTLRAELAIDAAQRRRQRKAELNAFFAGSSMVLSGWLMAVAFCLLSHQIRI